MSGKRKKSPPKRVPAKKTKTVLDKVTGTNTKSPTDKGDQRAYVEEVPDSESDEAGIDREGSVGSSANEEAEEDPEAQLGQYTRHSKWSPYTLQYRDIDRLQANWTAVIYAFYTKDVSIVYNNGRRAHKFHCAGLGCKTSILRYLGTNDSTSTSNLRKHVRNCKAWGAEALSIAEEAGLKADKTRACLQDVVRSGSIEKAFERTGKGKVTYASRQHTRTETRSVILISKDCMLTCNWFC